MNDPDVIVIGSGAGGAPVAARLCEAGATVLVVEKGPFYKKADFDRDEVEWVRRDKFIPHVRKDPHTRRNDEGLRAVPTADGWISCVVGGGTVHMGGYFLRAAPEDAVQATRFQTVQAATAEDWPFAYDALTRFYDQAEQELGVSGAPSGKDPAIVSHEVAGLVDAAAKTVGVSSAPTPRAILTVPRPDEDRAACAYHALCGSYGCPNDAKGAMGPTYIRRAERTGKLILWTEAMATRLVKGDKGRIEGVVVKRKGQGETTVKAKVVVLAAGAIESARLLLLSGPGLTTSTQVGKNLWFSLFTEVVGRLPRAAFAEKVPALMAGSPFLNRTVMAHGAMSDKDQAAHRLDRAGSLHFGFVHDNPIHRAERAAVDGGFVFGSKLKERLHTHFREGRHIVVEGFGEAVPHKGSYIDLDPRVKDRHGLKAARITHFHHPRDQRVAQVMRETSQKVLTEMGCTEVKTTVGLGETTSLQGGTCRMGKGPETAVVDETGQVFGTTNLYVTCGGALPSSLNVPPTLTIIANALRVAEGIAKARTRPAKP